MRILIICAGFIGASHALGQGDDTPTGLAGGFGGSITTGGGSFDPYERNASRSVTDIVVPGAVVPFTYTRIWNSRSGWRSNWSWMMDEIIAEGSNGSTDNLFKGYRVTYPDGRVVKFDKPTSSTTRRGPGTYSPGMLLQDRLVIPPDVPEAQLHLTDGTVVNFDLNDMGGGATSIVDPHGLTITITFSAEDNALVIQEPGGRKIFVHYDGSGRVTTSLGQSVTYTSQARTGLYPYAPGDYIDPDDDRIFTNRSGVTYNDVIDPTTGQPIEAHYVYKTVQPPFVGVGPAPSPLPTKDRLIWASDPMFDGPLQQIKYTYVDHTSDPTGDVYMTAVMEERSAPNYWDPSLPLYHDPGTRISQIEMLPWTWSYLNGESEGYYTRQETTGYGGVRTFSYFNPTRVHPRPDGSNGVGLGQNLVDHFTDFTNDFGHVERHEYDWADGYNPQFQTPTRITDPRGIVTEQTLDPVLGHLRRQTHPADDHSFREWTYTDPAKPYFVGETQDELGYPIVYTRYPDTDPVNRNLVHRIDYPFGASEEFTYNQFNQVRTHLLPSGATQTYEYDDYGLLRREYNDVDGEANATIYTYDSLDRVETVSYAWSRAQNADYGVKLSYNGRHQITKVEYPNTPQTPCSTPAPAPAPSPSPTATATATSTPTATATATSTATSTPTATATATSTPTATSTATATATSTPTATASSTATATATATPMSQVAVPTFNLDSGLYPSDPPLTITVTTATAGASMRYTLDGTSPTNTNGTLIEASSGTVSLTSSAQGTVLKAVAFKNAWITSDVNSATYSMPQVALPAFNPGSGIYYSGQFPITVTLTTTIAGANMRYTLDGSTPTENSGTLIAATTGTVLITGESQLKAVAFKAGWIASAVQSASYIFNPDCAPWVQCGAGPGGLDSANLGSNNQLLDDGGGASSPATARTSATTPGPSVNYEYDGSGNCTAITTLSAGGDVLEKTTYTYDQYKRCTGMVESAHIPSQSRTWNWSYDGYFQWPDGSRQYVDQTTHTSKQWRQQVESAYDAAGNRRVTQRVFDLNDRIVEEKTGVIQGPGGGINDSGPDVAVQHFGYDENGQKNDYIDPRGRETTYDYDIRNRLWKTNETVNTIPRTTEIRYDHAGNKTDVFFPVEAGGQRSQHWLNYDAFGQASTFIDERNNRTDLVYVSGPMKKLFQVTTHRDKDGGGTEDQTTTFYNDELGRPHWTVFPDGSTELTIFVDGQPYAFKTRKGQIKRMFYDARGRETSHTWDDHAAPDVSRSWDDANRVLTLCNIYSTIDFQYDGAGLVWQEGNSIAGSGGRTETTFWRYPDGNVSDVRYPDGILIHRDYTSRGQLKSVTDNRGSQPVINYTYLPDGKVEYADYRNGVHSAYGYDGRGMTNSIQYTRGDGANLSSRTYWRDERDRITAYQKSTQNSVNPMENGRGDRFRYDEEGQLVEAWYNASNPASSGDGCWRSDAFSYDRLGNRRGVNYVQGKGWIQFTLRDNGLNQYHMWGTYPATYDDENGPDWGSPQHANGVMMVDGNVAAGYNALNQAVMINSQALGSDWLFLGYDPLGRCVKRWTGSLDFSKPFPWTPAAASNPATYFYYEGWNLIQEGTSFANASRNYVHGARVDEIVKQIRPTDWWERYFHYDARGHCTLQTDTGGNIVEQYEYDAFGTPYFFDGGGHDTSYSEWGNRFLFTGREWLSNLKLYDYRNRMYQPELGRFMQPDPKEFGAGDYNLYRYCHNDPVNKSDPTGMYEEDVHLILTEYLAINAGFSQESAHAIALANQRTDTNSSTSPYLGGGDARRAYHFTSEGRRQTMRKEAFDTKSEEKFGQYLHALQDSYSHQRGGSDRNGEPYGANLGHIGDGHAPDKTSKRPELANKMAKDTYNEMRRFYQNQTGKEAPNNWDTIEKPVNVFVRTPR